MDLFRRRWSPTDVAVWSLWAKKPESRHHAEPITLHTVWPRRPAGHSHRSDWGLYVPGSSPLLLLLLLRWKLNTLVKIQICNRIILFSHRMRRSLKSFGNEPNWALENCFTLTYPYKVWWKMKLGWTYNWISNNSQGLDDSGQWPKRFTSAWRWIHSVLSGIFSFLKRVFLQPCKSWRLK